MSGATGAAAATIIAQAIRASGVIVHVEAEAFRNIVERQERPLVVHARGGFLSKSHSYVAGYKGLAFFTKTETPIHLPGTAEVVEARKIWVPG